MATIKTNMTSGTSSATFKTLEGTATIKKDFVCAIRPVGSMSTEYNTIPAGSTVKQIPGGVYFFSPEGENLGGLVQRSTSISEVLKNA